MIGFNPMQQFLIPPEPPNLTTAVKDYQVWVRDQQKPLIGASFETLKSRIVSHAIALVASGKLVDLGE